MKEELKPCPFCGESPFLRQIDVYPNGEKSPAFLRCRNCGIILANGLTDEKVIENWNTRPVEDALRAELDQVHKMLIYANSTIQNKDVALEAYRAELDQARTFITVQNEKIDYLVEDREPLANRLIAQSAELAAANADAERLAQLLQKLRIITVEHHEVTNIGKLSKIGWGDPCPVCEGGEIFVEVQAGIEAHERWVGEL